jgi:hypothetical protein
LWYTLSLPFGERDAVSFQFSKEIVHITISCNICLVNKLPNCSDVFRGERDLSPACIFINTRRRAATRNDDP